MAKEMCRHHPQVYATGTCKQCAIPICDACKTVRPQGIFCSEECAQKFSAFQSRMAGSTQRKSGGLFGSLKFKRIMIIGCVLVAFLLFLHFAYGVDSLGNLPSGIASLWYDLIGIFR